MSILSILKSNKTVARTLQLLHMSKLGGDLYTAERDWRAHCCLLFSSNSLHRRTEEIGAQTIQFSYLQCPTGNLFLQALSSWSQPVYWWTLSVFCPRHSDPQWRALELGPLDKDIIDHREKERIINKRQATFLPLPNTQPPPSPLQMRGKRPLGLWFGKL